MSVRLMHRTYGATTWHEVTTDDDGPAVASAAYRGPRERPIEVEIVGATGDRTCMAVTTAVARGLAAALSAAIQDDDPPPTGAEQARVALAAALRSPDSLEADRLATLLGDVDSNGRIARRVADDTGAAA